MMKNLLLMVLAVTLFSCNSLPSKSTAKELVRQHVVAFGETDGGSPVTITEVIIKSITKEGEKAKINFTWSGVRRSPAIANPYPPKDVDAEKGTLYAVKKNGDWTIDTDER